MTKLPPAPTQPAAKTGLFSSLNRDVPAGVVVFLVALPLCLGIAQASGAPLLSGLIAGVVGGLVITAVSRSNLSVSGPAAGLTAVVSVGITTLGFRAFLLALVIAGVLQVTLGVLRLGSIAHYFPSAVIKGMLAAIGVLIIFKQLPHAVGYDKDWEGDMEVGGRGLFDAIPAVNAITPAAVVVALACFALYAVWPRLQKLPGMKFIPAAMGAVVLGALVILAWPGAALEPEHMVALPVFTSFGDLASALITPDWSMLRDGKVWSTAITICIVASIETLLCLEAVDRLDPERRISPPNRELIAQGIGNLVSGLIGGLPMTSVIVRSSANVQAGAKTRLAAMVHGGLLLLSVLFMATLFNHVPLAALAVVLLVVGSKLTPPKLWKSMWRAGASQFVPFAVTVFAVVATDLLKGTLIGLVVGLFFAIRRQQKNAIVQTSDAGAVTIRFTKDMTFLQKAALKETLRQVPEGSVVTVDRSACDFVDDDIEELLLEFTQTASSRRIEVRETLTDDVRARRASMAPAH
ncbi:MAG: SulP family inorganic anion transporter [Archangium sp.]